MCALSARLLAAALFLSSAVAAPSREGASTSGYERAGLFRGPQNHLLLLTTANGKPATFLLDTGAEISFLRADRASDFGLRLLAREGRSLGRSFPLAALDDLQAGSAHLRQTTFALYESSEFGGPIPGRNGKAADGVIGLDVLRRYRAVINCRTREVFFRTDPARRLALATTTRAMGFVQVPIRQSRRGYLAVPCSIRGRPGQLVVDTGAFVTALDDEAMRAIGLPSERSLLTARGFNGRVRPVFLAQTEDLKIGAAVIAPQKFAVMDLFAENKPRRTYTGINRIEYYSAQKPAPGERIFGLLGNELLDQRRAIIDLDGMSLFLK